MLSHHLCPQASYHHPNPHTDNRKRLMPSQLYFLYNCLIVQGSFKFSQRLPDMPLQSASLRAHKPSWTSSLQTTAPSHCISSLPKELQGQKAIAGSSNSGFSTWWLGVGGRLGKNLLLAWLKAVDPWIGKPKIISCTNDFLFHGTKYKNCPLDHKGLGHRGVTKKRP